LKNELKSHDQQEEDLEFPKTYEIVNEIKSPLNVLWYNLNFDFEDKYPAKMSEDFARDMIKLYSKEGDHVFDPMCGSGTTVRVADSLGRFATGHDINPKAIELCKKKHPGGSYGVNDARTEGYPYTDPVKLILTSSPFGLNIIGDKNRYSDEPKDLSHCKTYPQFFGEVKKVWKNCFDVLAPGGILIFDARDRTKDGEYHDLGVIFRNMCVDIGFKVICRYWYLMIPYRQMTFKHKETRFVMPMVSAMDAYVMYKPEDSKLTEF